MHKSMQKKDRNRKSKIFHQIIDEHIEKNLFYDIVDAENETIRKFNRVPENEKYQDAGIKAALMLQFEPFFGAIIKMGICIGFVFVMKDFCVALSGNGKMRRFEIADSLSLYTFDVIYLLDVLLMLSYRRTNTQSVDYLHSTRHILVVMIELISIIPLELLYILNCSEVDVKYETYCILRMRLIRLFVRVVKNASATTLITDIIMFISMTTFFVILCTVILIITGCRYNPQNQYFDCNELRTEDILQKSYKITGKLTGIVIEDFASVSLSEWLVLVSVIVFVFIIVTMGRVTFYFIQINVTAFQFTVFHEYVTNFLHKNRKKDDDNLSQIDILLTQTLKKYIDMLYDRHVTTASLNDKKSLIIPEIIYKEITCDIYWDALKHVELFQDVPADFLRYISTLVVHQFYTEGEPIYTRSETMSKLVIIMNGIVKVHSETNGETPIISFTNGTVLGASTLALSRNSTTYVTCHNFCETAELHRKDFIKASVKYPQYVHDMTVMIMERCNKARDYLKMSQFQTQLNIVDENKELLSIRYIKHKLRIFLGKDIDKVNTQQIWSYDDQRILENEKRSIFCSEYIRNFVITKDQDLDPDITFMRRGIYFKFRPESPVVLLWNYLIVILALLTGMILPYYISFVQRMTATYVVIIISITFIWFLDMVLQLVTGVETVNHSFNEFVDIFKFRMKSFCYIVDIVACIPFELLIYILEGDMTIKVALILQMNRILKLYRFNKLCIQRHWSSVRQQLYVTYAKYIVLFAYWVYFVAAILNQCMNIKLAAGLNKPHHYLLKNLLLSLQFLTGLDTFRGYDISAVKNVLPLLCLQLCILCIKMYIICDIASTEALCEMRNSQYASFCTSLKSTIKCFNLDKVSEKRLWANVNLQWLDNKAERILKKNPLQNLSVRLHELLNYSAFGHHLHNMELLKDLPDNVIRTLCLKIDIRVIPCDEVVTYAGDNAREMFLILQGFCGRLDNNGRVVDDILKAGNSISVLEMLHGFRSTCTVIALTDCKMAVFERNKFISEMTRYPDLLDDIMETLWCTVTRPDLERIITIGAGVAKYKVQQKPIRNFFFYSYFLTYGSKAFYTYLYQFPRRLNFLRYFVFHLTICNNGSFIFYYEIVRCICAYMTCFLGSFPSLTNCAGSQWGFIFSVLDASAWIDIVLRHYICYYNSMNMQERHPANTILYYWTHGFLIDLIAVIPFDTFVNSERRLSNKSPISIYIWNRCLQLYRPYFLKRHIQIITDNSWLIACLLDFLQVLILTILVNHLVGHLNGLIYEINRDQFEQAMYKELHDLVITASLFLNVGYKPVKSIHSDYVIILLIFFGNIYIAVAVAKAFGISLFCNVDITTYQGKMNDLVKFLNYRRIDQNLKNEIIKHFEYIWRKRRGKVVHESIESLNNAFKEDILYAVYGNAVKKSSVFAFAPKAFIQNYLLAVQHVTFLKRAIIYKVNDVHGYIYFLYKGKVDVLGPDENILTTLQVGSFFGCLDRCKMSRQTLTMVASGHCEILTIKSLDFHIILQNFSDLRQLFREQINFHVDFINGMYQHSATSSCSVFFPSRSSSLRYEKTFGLNPSLKCDLLKHAYKKVTAVITDKMFHHRWSLIIATLTMVFFIMEIYQKVTLEMNVILIVILYSSDLMTLYKIYTEFHLAVQDEYGHTVITRSMIAQAYRAAYLGLYFDVFTVVPLELLILPFVQQKVCFLTVFRCNRLFRILIVFNSIYKQMLKLDVNVYMLRTALAFLMMFTIQQITIIGLVRNELMNNEQNKLKRYLWINALSVEIICMVLVPSELIEGNCWYKVFIVVKVAYLRICFLYFISACTTALFMSHHKSFLYWRVTDRLVIFMKRLKISQPLLDRVVAYIKLFWIIHNGMQFPEFLDDAPYYLREAVLNSMFGSQIQSQPLLGQCHIDLFRQIVAQIRTKTFFLGDFITFVGDIDETMYFIHEGEIVALVEDNLYEEVVVKTYTPGQMFGLAQGILRCKGHDYTFRATKYTVLLLLTRSDWIYLLEFFPASQQLVFNYLRPTKSDKSLDGFERMFINKRSF